MLGSIVKRFEWPLVKKELYKCTPFTTQDYTTTRHYYYYALYFLYITIIIHYTAIIRRTTVFPALGGEVSRRKHTGAGERQVAVSAQRQEVQGERTQPCYHTYQNGRCYLHASMPRA